MLGLQHPQYPNKAENSRVAATADLAAEQGTFFFPVSANTIMC